MNGLGLIVCGALASLMMAGCNQGQPSAGAAITQGSVKADSPARATLHVAPGTVDSCEVGATIDPVITWQRADPSVQKTRVMTDSIANPEQKLFSQAGFGGSARAGNWVVAGTRFHVFDDDTGAELASYTVTTTNPCNR
jgi:hypothetical protein